MSASIRATAETLGSLSEFIEKLTTATVETGCKLGPHMRAEVELPDEGGIVRINWDEDIPAYVVDDTIGD